MMRQYASPYKGYLAGAVLLNILSAIFNIFSFAILVPLLNILFKVDSTVYQFIPWDTEMNFKDVKSLQTKIACHKTGTLFLYLDYQKLLSKVISIASFGTNFGSVVIIVLPPALCGSSSFALSFL